MSGWEYWGVEDAPHATMTVEDSGFEQPAGFVRLKETEMKHELTPDQVRRMQEAEEIRSAWPALQHQHERMQESTLANAFKHIREGSLTPDRAVALWMEMYAYERLNKRLEEATSYKPQE